MKRRAKMRLKMIAIVVGSVLLFGMAVGILSNTLTSLVSDWGYKGACENVSSNVPEMEECMNTLRDNLAPEDSNYLSACDGVEDLEELYQCVGIEEEG